MSDDGGSMTSYCPHCGTPGPDEARFCMTCGRERPPVPPTPPPGTLPTAPPGTVPTAPPVPAPAAPLTPPPSAPPGAPPVGPPPPPPPYAPVPARPSPVGAFFGRAFRGDWGGSAAAALWPVGLLLAAALALAIPSYGQGTADEDDFVGFGDRLGLALAGLLQGLGGGFRIAESGGGDFSGDYRSAEAALTLTFVPLTVTVLFIGALFLAVRQLRTRLVTRAAYAGAGYGGGRTTGLEAAVRVTLLVTAAVLLLGLFAQPEVARVEASTSPWRAALGALLLTAVVSVGLLQRDDLAAWLAVRPGPRTLFRATGTAVRAMAIVLALCSLVTFVVLAANDEWQAEWEEDLNPLLLVLLVLPNLAVHLLGLSWGASVQGEAGRTRYGDDTSYDSSGDYGLVEAAPYGDYERESFGLSELGDAVNSWAVVGALTLGVVCALVLGVLAARRSSGRGEQLLAAGVFCGLFLLLAGVSGFGMETSGSATAELSTEFAVAGQVDVGLDIAEALLFGLLWIFVAAFLAPYLVQMTGARTAVIAPPVPPMPSNGPAAAHGVPGHSSTPAPAPYEPPLVELGHHHLPPAEPPKSRNGTLIWTLTIAVAFVIGGGGAAAIMLWQK
ncbi:zinc-ribbon domain-containing protein [Streptomyces sp. SP18BB07]|uniref:zinc-ribbon domain-containing protein n=1 Tax=Streptomyces sp. SP18BB07 TaxID=3002522 RepID=UPI002E780822|nr:zinc-ribbon domain-containing protein [Streptomyces sp. SP18BB07]MEE1759193.1 zinc-ribbon domain-containing protein [Streptomyces sp. SP18BB07]